jgi:predicted acylesterase/phospholipase RssA
MIAAALACGITPAEIKEIIGTMPYPQLMDKPSWLTRLPVIPVISFALRPLLPEMSPDRLSIAIAGLISNGAFQGWFLEEFTATMLRQYAEISTFGDHANLRAQGKGCGLAMVAYDLKRSQSMVFPRDFRKYHLDAAEQTLASGVRASASIAMFYQPKVFIDPLTNEKYPLVDGGVCDGYPYHTAQAMNPSLPTVGILLGTPPIHKNLPLTGIFSGAQHLIAMQSGGAWGRVMELLETEPARSHTIWGRNLPTYQTDFNPKPEHVAQMWEMGYADGEKWVARQRTLDFPDQEVA